MAAKIIKASFPGHVLTRPTSWQSPFIFASPHSGREYPARFVGGSILDLIDLRRSEDAYVDALLPAPRSSGIPLMAARFPRAFVDVNRNAREIDATMFSTPLIEGGELRSNRVLAGYGAIPRLAAEGKAIYARKLTAQEGRARLEYCYEPYHATLRELIRESLGRFGVAYLIDWHSMPSSSIANTSRLADIVLGDRYGTACGAQIIDRFEAAFLARGLTVARNAPYAGGYVATLYGRPSADVHVLQIEINRSLYLNEHKVARNRPRFDWLANVIEAVVAEVVHGTMTPWQVAAE
jgi:N-formylglutamate amidohydrolase